MRNSSSAFTLVEILVVVAIIALLAALSLAGYGAALKSAQCAACAGHMRSIGIAAISYAGDNNQDYPFMDNQAWDVAIEPYLGNIPNTVANPVLKCPSDPRPLSKGGSFARSYAFNGNLNVKTLEVAAPAKTIMLQEWYTDTGGPAGGGTQNYQYLSAYAFGVTSEANPTGYYHGTYKNFLFADGHIEKIDPTTTQGPPSMWTLGP